MDLFILLSRFPYPIEKGDKLRAYYQIKSLSQYHTIYLCALTDTAVSNQSLKELERYCKEVHIIKLSLWIRLVNLVRSVFSFYPFQVAYFYSPKHKRKIVSLIETIKPQHIYCQLIRTAEYVKELPIPKTIDYQDVFSQGAFRRLDSSSWLMKTFLTLEYRRLIVYEHHVFPFFNHKIIISETDKELIPHPDNDTIHVIPNGVDTTYFSPMERTKTYDILFSGNMAYPPNINSAEYLVKKILPLVKEKLSQVRVLIAGATPTAKVVALASDDVCVSGWVDDMRESYAQSSVFVAPMLIGTGLQNKLLEAMAMGLPCVTSPLANSALNAIEGEAILVGRTEQEYANHIIDLLENPLRAKEMAQAGLSYVIRQFNWDAMSQHINTIIT